LHIRASEPLHIRAFTTLRIRSSGLCASSPL